MLQTMVLISFDTDLMQLLYVALAVGAACYLMTHKRR